MPSEYAVAIVGLGSRGCSVFERIVALARLGVPGAPTRVEIIDPRSDGQGLHGTDQPDYLLLNTLCGEISMYPDEESVGSYCGPAGPDLHSWVTERGLRLAEDGHTLGPAGRPVRPTDFLPRRVLGEYLRWFFEQVRRGVPDGMRVTVHRSAAVDLDSDQRGGVTITLADGSHVRTDYAFLTIGHTGNEPPPEGAGDAGADRRITDPYPLPRRLDVIGAGETVAVAGFGLSAMDVIASLTVGRGGRFERQGGALRYRPSGAEPRILLYSRSGVPFRARPDRAEIATAFPPIALTRAAVRRLRDAGPIDFDRAILPLLMIEMRVAYHRCRTLLRDGPDAQEQLAAGLAEAAGDGKLVAAVDSLDRLHGGIDPAELWDGSAAVRMEDSDSYQRWLLATIRADLDEADRGVLGSPIKAALEAIRDVRDFLRDAVAAQGLAPGSREHFFGQMVPLMNRAVVGPQKDRHHELVTLAEAGLIRFPLGPAPRAAFDPGAGRWELTSTRLATVHREHADWLCAGSSPWPTVHSSASPLVRSLYQRGRLRRHAPGSAAVHAADVDANLHPVGEDGSDPRLWLIGPLCEGPTFYNHLIPTPGYSRAFVDAHRCVAEMFHKQKGPQS
ncbi:FAD/NAD(P)-binding protein [Verrucosispora sp. WMMD1129]|uniref:FAD/NAD(P)-binding protein n=1 Tax=Verrucosispora sp. WMMD1129 TaxID=3016093 RepID=UPI00249B94C1|nr:FAD/NAD(P)-binding protein [Verrucosispora sp. WMMD1129]WFE47839.1 FAD/NAD(P)-binding protein [Verrucosispora sp. WMMD1129]